MPRFLRLLVGQLLDQRIGVPVAAAGRVVLVPAGAGLLAVASHLEQPIGNRRLRPFRARLADRLQVLPDARADVDAGDVLHAVRPDRQPELGQHAIDLLDARAFLEQQVRLAHVVGEHAVGDEPEAVADDDADLAELLGELERGGDHLLARLAAADDLEQLHHVRRAEVVVAEHLRRPAARACELIDVERRRIRREDAVGARHLAEFRERGLLQVHVLEHRFGDDVHLVEAVVAGRRRDQRHRLFDLLRGHLALRHRDFVVAPDRRDAAIERRLVHFLEQDRNAGVRVVHRDAAAHRAGADDRRALDRP